MFFSQWDLLSKRFTCYHRMSLYRKTTLFCKPKGYRKSKVSKTLLQELRNNTCTLFQNLKEYFTHLNILVK